MPSLLRLLLCSRHDCKWFAAAAVAAAAASPAWHQGRALCPSFGEFLCNRVQQLDSLRVVKVKRCLRAACRAAAAAAATAAAAAAAAGFSSCRPDDKAAATAAALTAPRLYVRVN